LDTKAQRHKGSQRAAKAKTKQFITTEITEVSYRAIAIGLKQYKEFIVFLFLSVVINRFALLFYSMIVLLLFVNLCVFVPLCLCVQLLLPLITAFPQI